MSWLTIVLDVLVSSAATVVFNALDFFFDNFRTDPIPAPGASVFSVAAGCALAVFGVAIGSRDPAVTRSWTIASVALLLFAIGLGDLAPVFLGFRKPYAVAALDLVSMIALTWALVATNS